MQNIYILFFYAASFLFYFADVLQKITSNQQYTWSYIFKRSLYTTTFATIASFFISGIQTFPTPLITFKIFCASLLCAMGFFYYIKAVNILNFSNVGALSIVGTVFQILIGIILFQESFNWWIVPILILMSLGNIIQILSIQTSKGAIDVLLSVFFWTTGYTALSRVLKNMDVIWSVPIMELAILILSGLIMVIKNEKPQIQNQNDLSFKIKMLLIAFLIFCGSYLNNLSYKQIPVSVISVFQLSIMPLSYMISLKIFKEKPSVIELLSFVTGFVGFAFYLWMKSKGL